MRLKVDLGVAEVSPPYKVEFLALPKGVRVSLREETISKSGTYDFDFYADTTATNEFNSVVVMAFRRPLQTRYAVAELSVVGTAKGFLNRGTTLTGLSGAKGSQQKFYYTVPPETTQNFKVSMSGSTSATNDADVAVGVADVFALPCQETGPGSNATCSVYDSTYLSWPGKRIIILTGKTDFSGVTLKLE